MLSVDEVMFPAYTRYTKPGLHLVGVAGIRADNGEENSHARCR